MWAKLGTVGQCRFPCGRCSIEYSMKAGQLLALGCRAFGVGCWPGGKGQGLGSLGPSPTVHSGLNFLYVPCGDDDST